MSIAPGIQPQPDGRIRIHVDDVWGDEEFDLDLGDEHWLRWLAWAPDRTLNPQYAGVPDKPRMGALVAHRNPKDGHICMSGIYFEDDDLRRVGVFKGRPHWTVESWEPLTVSPSLLCCACGDHGFIRGARWVRA